MLNNEIKKKYSDFFCSKDHKQYSPASLIPENDSSVLFTSAGMQQFKRYYLNPESISDAKIITVQPCIRTSDIDQVGDATHLTFFEMLGNFSFGYPQKENSYFKEEAINWAWEFLTEILQIDKKKIYATYFGGNKNISPDNESKKILETYKDKGLGKIIPKRFEDNFWSLEMEGSPGGPTVELYVDDMEVWNLVFNEYIFENGKYILSKNKGVDTGMGLERLMMVLNKKKDVFENEIFEKWSSKINNLPLDIKQKRIILDHCRVIENIITAEVQPSNKDRGYILRRLIRRVMVILKKYDFSITELIDNNIIVQEAEKFNQTIEKGIKYFEKICQENKLNGRTAFDLFQSYGFPIELTMEMAKQKDLKISKEEYDQAFQQHQNISRSNSDKKFIGGLIDQEKDTVKLHTAAHLMLTALRKVLGDHAIQKGSNITSERLRFDFSHSDKLIENQIKQIEDLVNEQIKNDLPVTMEEMSILQAKKEGAMGIFDDRYKEKVKVYTIGSPSKNSGQVFSKEICNGPHVKHTGEINSIFKIVKEESSSSGVRRIKAILIDNS